MPAWRWVLYDPIVPESYELHINPNEGGTPPRTKAITSRSTASPQGKTIVFEGMDEPRTFEVSGVIRDQAHLEELDRWANKRHQIRLTDDLGRQFWIYITNFVPRRQRRATVPWYHTYTLSYIEVDI